MKKWIRGSGMLVMLLVLAACSKDEKAILTVNMNLMAEGNTINKGQVLNHPQGFPFKVDEFKLYISNVRLTDNKGNTVPLNMEGTPGAKEGVFLFWLGKENSFKGSLAPGQYTRLSFDLGLRPSLNDLDPNQFSREHPLSRNTDMYWDMLKYRFLTFEGAADPNQNGSYDLYYTYHLGGNDFLRQAELDINLNIENGKSENVTVKIDVIKIFSNEQGNIDITSFFSYHGQDLEKEKGLKMMDFLQASIE
jgi:hypothetical protein